MKRIFSSLLSLALVSSSISCVSPQLHQPSGDSADKTVAQDEQRHPATMRDIQDGQMEIVNIDANANDVPFPHFWDRIFGSGRAILATRESYRSDLREVKKATDFEYARFHEILSDDVGVYNEDESGKVTYNFTYVDDIYDGLLANGVRPFVELSYMPSQLAVRPGDRVLWNKTVISPPKDYKKWEELIRNFTQHLVDRYGLAEVKQWYFEVWNEAEWNWTGQPQMETYFELYSHTAPQVKAVNSDLRVGGPATSAGHWITEFLTYVAKNKLPVDFVSSHAYADDSSDEMFGKEAHVPRDHRVCSAIKSVRDRIKASQFPQLPLMWTEWSVPSFGGLHGRDTSYVAAGLAETVSQCDGLVDMMSYWTFSDVFDEAGPMQGPFTGWFGIMTVGGIKKPGYYGFQLLHQLGERRMANDARSVIVTRKPDKSLVVAAWNLIALDDTDNNVTHHFEFNFSNVKPNAEVNVLRVDDNHSNTLGIWKSMGSPMYPSHSQIEEINKKSEVHSEKVRLVNGRMFVDIPSDGLVLLEPVK